SLPPPHTTLPPVVIATPGVRAGGAKPGVFEDVAVYFTRKEWELLEDEDTVLYQHQMLRNFQALVSLGKSLVLASPWSSTCHGRFSLPWVLTLNLH
uniref:KRAB domain-containing protein n=1 Tax=Crocodylus porosus TaxID=8502 RepID=A0A7M4EA75_CROPO